MPASPLRVSVLYTFPVDFIIWFTVTVHFLSRSVLSKLSLSIRTTVERAGTEKTLPCDLLLVAAGFTGCEEYTAQAFNVALGERGTVATPNEYATGVQKIFAAGDMHRGQSLVVWAIAEGRECAKQIDGYLMNTQENEPGA